MFGIAMLLCCWRLLVGPDVLDRVLALDTLYVNVLAIVVLLGLRFETQVYFEAALVIAMLGFIGTVVTARFVSRGDLIDHD
jgi:multicomponent K+:H+ antiporter subunit F